MSAKTFPELVIAKNKEIERLTTEVSVMRKALEHIQESSGIGNVQYATAKHALAAVSSSQKS